MLLRALTFLVWAAVAGSVLYWGLKLFVSPLRAPANTTVAQAVPPPVGDLTRLLGAGPAEPSPQMAEAPVVPGMESRFQLIGVVAPRTQSAGGVALIAVDGKMPKAFRVGASVDGDTVLQGVQQRGATLGVRGGPAQLSLQLPPLPVAATGTLPPPATEADPAPGGFPPPPMGLPGQARPPGVPGRSPFAPPMGQGLPQGQAQDGSLDTSPGAPGALNTLPTNPFSAPPPNQAGPQDGQRRLVRPVGNATLR
jgi:general secretion pathway protein C